MANRPQPVLEYLVDSCPDCARRTTTLPRDRVQIPDDFDWTARDFEGFRRVMLEDLAAANPERQRWTEADMELALVEVLAAGLDRASHALDTVFAERFVATARMPASMVALLRMIDGIDPAYEAVGAELTGAERLDYGFDGSTAQTEALTRALTSRPQLMDIARGAGLSRIGTFLSFVTLESLAEFLQGCPLISKAVVRRRLEAGQQIFEAVLLMRETGLRLHDRVAEIGPHHEAFLQWFLLERDRAIPPDQAVHPLLALTPAQLDSFTLRTALSRIVTPLLPLGTGLRLLDGRRVGVFIRLCLHVDRNFFRSEVEAAARQILSASPGQLFDPQHYGFGDAAYLSDLEQALMACPGVAGVIISRFQIAGRPETEATLSGILRPQKNEALTLDPVNPNAETGYVLLSLQGGLVG